MRLQYSILWFENADDFIDSQRGDIEERLVDLGFKPNIIPRPNGDEALKLLKTNEVNLILMDYNLNRGTEGDEFGSSIIKKIRQNDFWTEIIFYSGKTNFAKAKKSELEGVYFAERGSLLDKTKKIIDLTIKKNQDLANVRGLIIAESIEIENKIEDVIEKYFDIDKELSEVFSYFFNPALSPLTTKHKTDIMNKITKARIAGIENTLKYANPISSELYTKLTRKKQKIEYIRSEISDIEKEVFNIRNILAHQKEEEGQDNKIIGRINRTPIEIVPNEEWCKAMRKKLRNYSEKIDDLYQIL